jgi:hypothetical protein
MLRLKVARSQKSGIARAASSAEGLSCKSTLQLRGFSGSDASSSRTMSATGPARTSTPLASKYFRSDRSSRLSVVERVSLQHVRAHRTIDHSRRSSAPSSTVRSTLTGGDQSKRAIASLTLVHDVGSGDVRFRCRRHLRGNDAATNQPTDRGGAVGVRRARGPDRGDEPPIHRAQPSSLLLPFPR